MGVPANTLFFISHDQTTLDEVERSLSDAPALTLGAGSPTLAFELPRHCEFPRDWTGCLAPLLAEPQIH
jgi:hypothetical protein